MEAQVPKQVSVAGVTIRVVRRDLTDIECYGQYDNERHRITLCSTLRGKTLWETFRHELLHAALELSGVSYADDYPEEVTIRALENLYFPVYERILIRQIRKMVLEGLNPKPPGNGTDIHSNEKEEGSGN